MTDHGPSSDVTEPSSAEEHDELERLRRELDELRRSERNLRAIVDGAKVGIVVIVDGLMQYVNPEVLELSGYTDSELASFSFTEFIHADDRKLVYDRHQRRLAGEPLEPRMTIRAPTRDGEHRILNVYSSLIEWDGRKATVGVLQDVTEDKRLETEINRSRRLDALGTLAGGIAHDFNNLLGSIMGFTELTLQTTELDGDATHNLERVLHASKRAHALVERILAFSRRADSFRKPICVAELARNTDMLIRAGLPSSIELRFECDTDDTKVHADPTQIEQVLINLCTNARQAMEEEGGVLTISLVPVELSMQQADAPSDLRPGAYLRLRVQDTGIGMAHDVQDRIFEPYFTTKPPGRGSGLGLAVCQGIVHKHGGAIVVDSAPGRGSTFDVLLPRLPADSAVLLTPANLKLYPGTETILLVDDEEPLVSLGEQLLGQFGYRVTGCTSAAQALALFRADPERYDVVVTDLTMPNMGGDKLATEVMAIRPDVPVILVTGYSERVDPERAEALGLKGYLKKPLDLPELTRTIREGLGEPVDL